jgi:hypothetical protein
MGRMTATYMWVADSGMINFRTYQESSSATIDATITTSDMLRFELKESPLGSSNYESQKASRIQLDFDYNFITSRFENSVIADPDNTALCNSAQAQGIATELIEQTKHIVNLTDVGFTNVASYYLGNRVRKHTQGEEFVEMELPARYFGLELCDVIKVKHPMIVGSESLYQVIALTPDYLKGTVALRASELLSLNPT